MLRRSLNSFRFAFAGIKRLIGTQPNARIHLLATVLVVAAGFFFQVSAMEWCVLILSICMVLAAEAFNTAVEDLTDLVSPDHHPLAGHAKDSAAGAVLIIAIGAAITGLIIFLPRFFKLAGFLLQ